MTALAALLGLLLLALVTGSAILALLRVPQRSISSRVVYGMPLGLGVIAYVVLALGLLGALRPGPVILALVSLVAVSALQLRARRSRVEADSGPRTSESAAFPRWIPVAGGLLLAASGFIILVNAFVPPGTNEWDALSYHLAAPKVYLEAGRIVYLPTDHHSNFPFTMQMLFLLGLMFDGFALANLVHFATAALIVAAIFVIGRNRFVPAARWAAAAVFLTCPLAVWQAGSAYVELGFALFVVTAIGALLEYEASRVRAWLWLCGLLLGFALSVKTLALIPLAITIGVLVLWRTPFRSMAVMLGLAVIVGSPFYVKSWIETGNPVYPFGYSVFGGRDWSAELAATYASEQRSFGQSGNTSGVAEDVEGIQLKYRPPSMGDRIRNLALAPFELVAVPRIFHNFNNPGVHSHIGFLAIALLPLPLFAGGGSMAARTLAGFCACWFLIWTQTMQYARYLLPMVPLLGIPGGEGAIRTARGSRLLGVVVVAAFLLQSALTLTYFGSKLPERIRIATDGAAREQYLTSNVNVYGAQQWLNRNTRPEDGVILFEETRGFYLNRPYLWGNGPHSLYIPYHEFKSGQDMARWFVGRGYRFALLNLQFSPHIESEEDRQSMMMAFVAGTAAALVRDWYSDSAKLEEIRNRYNDPRGPDYAPNRFRDVYWRLLLGDAVANGGAVINHEGSSRGAIVLEFRPS